MKSESQNTATPAQTDAQAEAQAEVQRACLSALADGDADALDRACAGWRDDAHLRQTWHTYQLIGDVMRSEDLACAPGRDAGFLAGLREQLAKEPVLLAPEASPPAALARRRQAWLLPVAAAAGFVLVAGVLVVTRVSQPGIETGVGIASIGQPSGVLAVGNGVPSRPVAVDTAAGDLLLRDERLDEYLRAHQFARGGAAVTAPSSALRQVDITVNLAPGR